MKSDHVWIHVDVVTPAYPQTQAAAIDAPTTKLL